MAKTQLTPCLFCDCMPCECGLSKKPKISKPVSKKSPPPAPQSIAPESASSADDIFTMSVGSRFDERIAEVASETLSQDELELNEAIRNLEPILSGYEKVRHKEILHPELSQSMIRRRSNLRRLYANEQATQ